MIADHAHSNDRGRQMGWFDYSTFLGYIVGAVLGGFLTGMFSVPVGFGIVTVLLAGSAVMLYALVWKEAPARNIEHKSGFAELRGVFRVREVRLMFPIWLIIATLLGLALTYLPIIMMDQKVEGPVIGLMFGLAGVALGLLQPFWGKVSDIVGRIPVMAYGVFSIAGIVVMLLFFPNSAIEVHDDGVDVHWLGMIPLAIMGLGAGAFVPAALAMMADSSESKSYGATMGLYSFALGFGAFIAEAIGLAIIYLTGSKEAPGWILYFAAGLVGLAVFMMIVFFLQTFIRGRAVRQRARIP
jgi:MFS family permease